MLFFPPVANLKYAAAAIDNHQFLFLAPAVLRKNFAGNHDIMAMFGGFGEAPDIFFHKTAPFKKVRSQVRTRVRTLILARPCSSLPEPCLE